MGSTANAILLLTLLATSPAVDSDCSINEIHDQNPCGGELSCDGDFNDAKNTLLQMPCLNIYDYDREVPDSYLGQQNFSVSIKAKYFDFFSTNDTSILNELNDHIADISITNGKIKKIPEAVSKLRQATSVDLSSNKIDSLNLAAFSELSKLNFLNISYNNIAYLDVLESSDRYSSVPLISIDLSHNNIQGIFQDFIPPYTTLRHLNLSFNDIETFHATAIHNMTALLTLDISNNRIIELDTALSGLASLEELFLNNNNLTTINKHNFYGMTSLKYLNISSNNLMSIENSSFSSLVALTQLDIGNNKIKVLSKSMFLNNKLLFSLDVSFNKIMKIESGAFAGAHIEDLKLHNNTLAECLDTDAFNGLYFEKLDLSDGDIAELGPDLFGPNPSFQSLNFSNNIISKISNTTFRKLHLLVSLDLSYNKLQNIEFDPTDLTNLVYLYINNNSIKKIRKNMFRSLTSVKTVDLSNNAIENIEILSFENLKRLHTLNLKNNPLTDIHPRTFIGLTSCYSLDISGTKIEQLKNNAFNGLESLNKLNLSNGDLKVLEFNVFNGTGSIEFLDLSHNRIESLSINNTNFKLQKILLSSNNIGSISKMFFQNLREVSIVDFSNNKISKVQPGSFRDCEMLQNFNLSSNMLSFLEFGVFDGMKQLRTIDLSNNKFQKFDPKILYDYYVKDKWEIEIIYLDNNLIENINFTDFTNANVRIVSIGGNFITCDLLASSIDENYSSRLSIAAKKLDFDTENVDGIQCKSRTELENATHIHGNALTENIYLENLTNLNIITNRYLAAILAAMLSAILISIGLIVYFKFRSVLSNSRVLSSSRQELSNAIELE